MAYPPAALATSRTNATPQTDTHPLDHNLVNQAVNDIVATLGPAPKVRVDGGFAEIATHPLANTGGVVLTVTIAAVSYPTVVAVTGWVSAASDTAALSGVYAAVWNSAGASSTATPVTNSAAAGRYVPMPVTYGWALPANTAATFTLNVGLGSAAPGTLYAAAAATWNRFRQ